MYEKCKSGRHMAMFKRCRWWILAMVLANSASGVQALVPHTLVPAGPLGTIYGKDFICKGMRRSAPGDISMLSWRLPKGTNPSVNNRASCQDHAMLSDLGVRLCSIASMIPERSRVVDVGCDHGLLSIG